MRGRIRTVKPEALKSEKLWELGEQTGMPIFQGFVGLWCFADREGRFEWRPRALKSDILPYWDGNFEELLDALCRIGSVIKYVVNGVTYGLVKNLKRDQRIDHKEAPSELPSPELPGPTEEKPRPTAVEGKGREQERKGGEGNAAPPQPAIAERRKNPEGTCTTPVTWNRLGPDYVASQELEDEAVMFPMSREYFRIRVKKARNQLIGGKFGVLDRDEWVRDQFRYWALDEQNERSRSVAARARGSPANANANWEPSAKAVAYAKHHQKNLAEFLPSYRAERHPEELSRNDADADFQRRLVCLVKTGKWIPTGPLPQQRPAPEQATGT